MIGWKDEEDCSQVPEPPQPPLFAKLKQPLDVLVCEDIHVILQFHPQCSALQLNSLIICSSNQLITQLAVKEAHQTTQIFVWHVFQKPRHKFTIKPD